VVFSSRLIFWDFDGTLVDNRGLWSAALKEVLDIYEPGHGIDTENLRPYLREGFFWHNPERPHTYIKTANEWWAAMSVVFARAYRGVGYGPERASQLAGNVRECYINPKRFTVRDDAVPVLKRLAAKGWKHAVLSNHVPELPEIVKSIGLSAHLGFCITSATTGWEKPNPEAFRHALNLVGNPRQVWIVGDDPEADVKGAEAAGLPAILVRSPKTEGVRYCARDLFEAAAIIESAQAGTTV